MMILDVRKLNAAGRYSGELSFDYDAPAELIDIPFVRFASPVRIEAKYVLYEDDSADVTGKVTYVLEGECSRCLKETSQAVEGELDACFSLRPEGEEYPYSGGKIDLTDAVNDAILASMPRVLLCKENCEGIPYQS